MGATAGNAQPEAAKWPQGGGEAEDAREAKTGQRGGEDYAGSASAWRAECAARMGPAVCMGAHILLTIALAFSRWRMVPRFW